MKGASQSSLRHRWKVLGAGVLANAVFSAAFQGLPTTAIFMRTGYEISTGEVGVIIGLMGLGIAISELPWGILTDKLGDRLVLLIGLVGILVTFLTLSIFLAPNQNAIPSYTLVAICMFFLGALGGSINGASGRAISFWFEDKERGFAMSVRQTAVPLGGGLGAIFLPILASKYGFTEVFGALAVSAAAALCLAWLWVYDPVATHGNDVKSLDVAQLKNPLKDWDVWKIAIAIGILCAPQFAILTFGSIFFHDVFGAGIIFIGVTLMLIQIGAITSRIWSGIWTDKKGNRKQYLRYCSFLSAGFFCLTAVICVISESPSHDTKDLLVYIAPCFVITGIIISAWHGVAFAELISVSGKQKSGTALGMANSCVFATYFIVPSSIPLILNISSWSIVWFISAFLCVIAVPLLPRNIVVKNALCEQT